MGTQGPRPKYWRLYPKDFWADGDVVDLGDPIHRCAYLALLSWAWERGAVLRDPLAALRSIGFERSDAVLVWDAVAHLWEQVDGGWTQGRLMRDYQADLEARETSVRGGRNRWDGTTPEERSEAARKAALARHDASRVQGGVRAPLAKDHAELCEVVCVPSGSGSGSGSDSDSGSCTSSETEENPSGSCFTPGAKPRPAASKRKAGATWQDVLARPEYEPLRRHAAWSSAWAEWITWTQTSGARARTPSGLQAARTLNQALRMGPDIHLGAIDGAIIGNWLGPPSDWDTRRSSNGANGSALPKTHIERVFDEIERRAQAAEQSAADEPRDAELLWPQRTPY